MITYTLKAVEKRQETADTVTLCFKQPALKKIKYKAGQYLTLIFRINGRRYIRPYSFSSSPGIDTYVEVTVKRIAGGVVSNHIIDVVKVGDLIEVMEPMGDFIVDERFIEEEKPIVLWGAGSGITPLFSIARFLLVNSNCKVTLVYGNRNFEAVIFHQKIRELETLHANKFSTWHFYTQLVVEANNPTLIQGRIKPGKVLSVMNAEGEVSNSIHYICGPAGLKESIKAALKTLHIPDKQIFSEDFELIKDEKDFEDIVTRQVTMTQDGNSSVVEVVKGKSILEAALDALLELPYSCQTGNCSVCKGCLVKGTIKYIGLKKVPETLQKNEYLLCCSYPVSDNVEVAV